MPARAGPVDYLAVGHVARDLVPGGQRLGGTAAYASLTARALGRQAGLLTACAPDLDLAPLNGVNLQRLDSPASTTFENIYGPGGRRQFLRGRALPLRAEHLPGDWRGAPLIHLAPLAGEIESDILGACGQAFLGLTPQGWLRTWDEAGQVSFGGWPLAETWLRRASAVVISLEDVGGDAALARAWAEQTGILVLTHGRLGCTLLQAGAPPRHVPAEAQTEVDPTGAGDIFAAAFFIGLQECGDPLPAARLANRLAGLSVTRPGLAGVPLPEEAAAARRDIE